MLVQACLPGDSPWKTIVTSALVGGLVGLGLNLVSAAATGAWLRRFGRGVASLLAGGLAGAVEDSPANYCTDRSSLPRPWIWFYGR